jgi:hypothetical protein
LKTIQKLIGIFTKKDQKSLPLLIIRKETEDADVKEYNSIEEVISDLEKDPNVPADKIAKLKTSLKNLKNKHSIKIRNGEIVK